ncbi:hypothetical protein RI578_06580 [Streptomyces sp. BB1-1-1]|uniref:hypothetical protein n=1 Tax=Streptomyces sp. BB1-1-1 TaxID=3074430 RepID=UPI002877560F|nr:hypothetical protein [Streptomyces sp. BB1-1-1]WND33979.1 hypothetical protein RI578_06580 [Streptomyces sp. BB1-1-1]
MNYRPYPSVDRALAQLERGRVPALVTTLRIDTSTLEAALSRFREGAAPRSSVVGWIDEHLAADLQLTDWQRRVLTTVAGPTPAPAVLPAPVDRRAVLREAADRIDNEELPPDYVDMFDNGARWAAKLLRRVADETAATETQADAMAALRTIRRDMDTARSGGDEWASEWFGDVWSQFPLALRAAAGDEDAATELAAAARQHAALPATADLFTGPQWDTYDPEAEEIERDIQRDAHIPARADNPGSMTPLPDDAARQDGAQP